MTFEAVNTLVLIRDGERARFMFDMVDGLEFSWNTSEQHSKQSSI